MQIIKLVCMVLVALLNSASYAETNQRVVDISTRPGVTQRILIVSPPAPKAAAILFAGGHGGLQIASNGSINWGRNNFLVRTRELFANQGLFVVIVDAPSDRQSLPYLNGFRQMPEHAEDIKAVIDWTRKNAKLPVWLIGTSRGTQSAAYVATQLTGPEGPDSLVLTSTILSDNKSRAVTEMPLDLIHVPVLVIHHEEDGCKLCPTSALPALMNQFTNAPKKKLLTFNGGSNTGDPCEAMAHHGFNGIEPEVVHQLVAWMVPGTGP